MLSIFLHRTHLVPIVFITIALAGVVSVNDYGISQDELAVKNYGEQVFTYLFDNGDIPPSRDWKFYGPIWPLTIEAVFRISGIENVNSYWILRHSLTFILFYLSLVAVYSIGLKLFRDWRYALLAVVFLFLSPRVFAHSFYNPKDIPALAFFTFSMWSLLRFHEKKTIPNLLIHGFLCGVLISSRLFGLIVPLFTVLLLVTSTDTKKWKWIGMHIGTVLLFTYIVWPALWQNPVQGFLTALGDSSRIGGGFYFGETIQGPLLSASLWHYPFVWISITTPILYTVLFIVGTVLLAKTLLSSWREKSLSEFVAENHAKLIVAGWFFGSLGAIYVSGAGIFGEWRQILFVYPAFILIAVLGLTYLQKLWTHPPVLLLLKGIICFSLLTTGVWMTQNHAKQYVYFSIPSAWADGNFALDYWGLSYRDALKWIAENDQRPLISVYAVSRGGAKSGETLPFEYMKRFYFLKQDNDGEINERIDADYILDSFVSTEYKKTFPQENIVHSITVDDIDILHIYRGR